jgi:hypothetical protein
VVVTVDDCSALALGLVLVAVIAGTETDALPVVLSFEEQSLINKVEIITAILNDGFAPFIRMFLMFFPKEPD